MVEFSPEIRKLVIKRLEAVPANISFSISALMINSFPSLSCTKSGIIGALHNVLSGLLMCTYLRIIDILKYQNLFFWHSGYCWSCSALFDIITNFRKVFSMSYYLVTASYYPFSNIS